MPQGVLFLSREEDRASSTWPVEQVTGYALFSIDLKFLKLSGLPLFYQGVFNHKTCQEANSVLVVKGATDLQGQVGHNQQYHLQSDGGTVQFRDRLPAAAV